jgi:hypothetical protein
MKIHAKSSEVRASQRGIGVALRPIALSSVGRKRRQHRRFDLIGLENGFWKPNDDPVDTQRGGQSGHKIEIAGTPAGQDLEPLIEAIRQKALLL